jgi:hypothetical protein
MDACSAGGSGAGGERGPWVRPRRAGSQEAAARGACRMVVRVGKWGWGLRGS